MKIIRNTADLAKYIEINPTAKFSYFSPSIRTAERRYLLAVLGGAQYARLAAAIADPSQMTEDLQALADITQEALANLAMSMAVTRTALTIDENGARRNETEKIKSAFQYQEIALKDSYVRAGFDALDDLLALMESKPEAYPEWYGSTAYQTYKKYFISSGVEFSQYFNIRNSRYTFLSVLYILQRVERFDLKPALGVDLFRKIKAQLLTGNVDENYQVLLDEYIRPALALLTISYAVIEKAVDVSDFGVTVNAIQDNSNSQQKQAAPLDKLREVAQQLREQGSKYLKELADELARNPTEYPDFQAPDTDSPLFKIQNSQDKSFVAV
ncbi:hypothetical protein KHS38_11760 [Mucilaginibacter sp. Bleaf8]|uniref:DUF6712 family protein n=1 Tax=Mucilaginibacter sp. Bleaf8 TaxID=2834430 RepID=UPI001BCB93D5|nr:DUF6712 family protein [Mucilaginibacter sp. Bleaf8]MBS7565081.1 hypothetical protein [Mucilaginibacter sp. Bleaf8]